MPETKPRRVQTWLKRLGIVLAAAAGTYLVLGMSGVVPLELKEVALNNIRVVSGVCILGCLMTAIGFEID